MQKCHCQCSQKREPDVIRIPTILVSSFLNDWIATKLLLLLLTLCILMLTQFRNALLRLVLNILHQRVSSRGTNDQSTCRDHQRMLLLVMNSVNTYEKTCEQLLLMKCSNSFSSPAKMFGRSSSVFRSCLQTFIPIWDRTFLYIFML